MIACYGSGYGDPNFACTNEATEAFTVVRWKSKRMVRVCRTCGRHYADHEDVVWLSPNEAVVFDIMTR